MVTDIFSIYSKTMLDNVDLWIQISNLLTKDDAKNPPWEEMFRNEVNRAISGALQQVLHVRWQWEQVFWRNIQMSFDLKTAHHWLP